MSAGDDDADDDDDSFTRCVDAWYGSSSFAADDDADAPLFIFDKPVACMCVLDWLRVRRTNKQLVIP